MIPALLQRWRQGSLANTLTLWATGVALVSVILVAGLSIAIIYWTESRAYEAELSHKSRVAANSLEEPILVVGRTLVELARSSLFTTALLDSGGRAAYARPFVQNFHFPIAARSGLALCDQNGQMLAGTPILASCRSDHPAFRQVLADGKTRQMLIDTPTGEQLWVILQGITYAYTGTTEGIAVGQVDVSDLLRPLPANLNLYKVSLQLRATSAPPADAAAPGSTDASGPLTLAAFSKTGPLVNGTPELRLEGHALALEQNLAPLLAGYGLAMLLLLALALLWARQGASRLVDPLLALRDKAQAIAASGDLSPAVAKGGMDEVGQLEESIVAMVASLREAEATRLAAEARYKLLFDTSSEAIIFAWPDGRIETANAEAVRLFGFSVDELRAQGRAGVMDLDDSRLSVALDKRARTGSFRGELRARRRDGRLIPVDVVSTIFRDVSGELRSSSMFRDITEQKHNEEDLKRYRNIVASTPEALALVDRDYRYQIVNKAYERFAGIPSEQLVGHTVTEYLGEVTFRETVQPHFDRCLNGETVTYQEWFEFPALGRRFVTVTYFPYRDADERIAGIVATTRDITERKQINDALQASLEKLRLRENALAAVSQGVLITDVDAKITYASDGFELLTGYAERDILGRTPDFLHGPGTDPETKERLYAAIQARQPFQGEFLNYRKDGSSFWNDLLVNPVFDDRGTLTQFVGIQRDVSERKSAALALLASQALIKTVFDSLDEQVVVLDPQGVILAANRAWRQFGADNGAPPDVVEGVGLNYLETCESAVSPSDADEGRQARDGIAAVLAGRSAQFSLDYPCHSPSEPRWFRMQAIPLQGPQRGAVVLHENITARIEGEQRLKALSTRLVEVQEAARRHLAGELHDRTSANLAAIMVNMDAAAMALGERDWQGVAERMADNRALVEDTTASIREICAELRPPALDYAGLIPAVESYAAQFSRRTGIDVEVSSLGRDVALSPDIESTLFRIVQEALTNVAKHAQAGRVNIEIGQQGQTLCLDIADDGRGFDPLMPPARGLGLINMREMAEFAGGSFVIETALTQGTRLHVEIPHSLAQT